MNITLQTKVEQSTDELLTTAIDDEVIMAKLDTSKYYGLDSTSVRIWELLAEPRTVGEICTHLQSEYDVEPGQCQADVITFVQSLSEAGLVEFVES